MTVADRQQLAMETENPERRGLRKGVYLIPSVFTAANIGMGFYAVMAAVRAFQFVETARRLISFRRLSISTTPQKRSVGPCF